MLHIVAMAWIFVVLLMALAEGISPQGSLLGAAATLLLYGLLPLALLLYLLGAPARRARRHKGSVQRRAAPSWTAPLGGRSAATEGLSVTQPDGGGHAPAGAVAPEREEA